MKSTRRTLVELSVLLLSAGGLPAPGWAADALDNRSFTFSGFGTLGAVYNADRKADFRRDLSQRDGAGYSRQLDFGVDSMLGLQLDASLDATLSGAVQVISHRRYDNSFRPELTWAFGKYAPNDNIELRVGRLGYEVYMLADSRSVGYSYTSIRPPVEYFGSNVVSYIDGADLLLKHPIGSGIGRFKIFAGRAREKLPTPPYNDQVFDIGNSKLVGAYGEYQWQHWQYRLGYAAITLANEQASAQPLLDALRSPMLAGAFGPGPARFADDASVAGKTNRYFSAGILYDAGPLQAHLMLSRLRPESFTVTRGDTGYFSLAYRLGEWTPYAIYSVGRSKRPARSTGLPAGIAPGIDALIGGADQLRQSSMVTQRTWSVGARYDFAPGLALKLQLDRVKVDQSMLWSNQQPDWDGRSTLFSVALDFVF